MPGPFLFLYETHFFTHGIKTNCNIDLEQLSPVSLMGGDNAKIGTRKYIFDLSIFSSH